MIVHRIEDDMEDLNFVNTIVEVVISIVGPLVWHMRQIERQQKKVNFFLI